MIVEKSHSLAGNDLFRSAFDYSSIGMALVGIDGSWLEVNDSVCRITGYSRQELLEKTFQEITHPDDLRYDLDYVEKLLSGQINHFELEKRYFHKNGHIVWILLTVSLVRDQARKPLFFISQIQDISERIFLRNEVMRRKSEVENILKNTASAIARFNRDCRYLYGNQMLAEILGVPLSEIIGKTLQELTHIIPYASRIEEKIAQVFALKSTFTFESKRVINGADVYLFTYLTPEFNENGEVETVVGHSTNITQLKNTENELRAALKEIEQLREILPICSYCKNIRDDKDYWHTVENYLMSKTKTQFSHSICPNCYESEVKPQIETLIKEKAG